MQARLRHICRNMCSQEILGSRLRYRAAEKMKAEICPVLRHFFNILSARFDVVWCRPVKRMPAEPFLC